MTEPNRLAKIAIENGGVIAYPTEAVFGLGCDPNNQQAVEKILALKQRPAAKGLIVVAATVEQVVPWLDTETFDINELPVNWPQATTYLLPANSSAPKWLTGEHDKIAIRLTQFPWLKSFCQQLGALVSTSANVAGKPSLKTADAVKQQFGEQVDVIIDMPCQGLKQPSSIVDWLSGENVR